MSELIYPDIRSLLLLKALDGHFLSNSSKTESISSSCEDNIVGISSTVIEYIYIYIYIYAFEELAELVKTLGGEISTLKVLFNSSSNYCL